MRTFTVFEIFLLGLAAVAPGRADSISLYSYAIVSVPTSNTPCSQEDFTGLAVSCSDSGSLTGDNGTAMFGGSSSAAAGFGILHAASSSTANCNVTPGDSCGGTGAAASGQSSFYDDFTITGAPAAGYLDFSVVAEGTGDLSCSGPYASDCIGHALNQPFFGVTNGDLIDGVDTDGVALASGTTDLSVLVPFTSIEGDALVAGGFSLDLVSQCYFDTDTSCNAYENFSDTAYVSGLTVLDQDGNPVPGATITAASGTNYNDIQPGSAVPEPSTIPLLAAAVAALWIGKRKAAKV